MYNWIRSTLDSSGLRNRSSGINSCRNRRVSFICTFICHFIIIIIIVIHAEIKVTLSQKCCSGTVQATTSHVCSHSNSYNWRHHVRSSLKDALNSSVFICRLNAMVYESEVLTDASRAFQACAAAATGNARSPSVIRRVVGTSNDNDTTINPARCG